VYRDADGGQVFHQIAIATLKLETRHLTSRRVECRSVYRDTDGGQISILFFFITLQPRVE